MASDQQEEEREILKSIYEGDENFHMVNDTLFQYKLKTEMKIDIMVELKWTENYPETPPAINLNLFCNKSLSEASKTNITNFINDQAKDLLNSAMTFSLIEALKENVNDLVNQPLEKIKVLKIKDVSNDNIEKSISSKQKTKKENLTKAQKRRLLNKQENGELPRGWNWVDIISHLSKTADIS